MVHQISFEIHATEISSLADHTYVHPVGYGSDFLCWGGNQGSDNRVISFGTCVYEIADCYRDPWLFGVLPDTAGIGIYAINGVCHQSANCFMYYSKATCTTAVRAYWATVALYGPYGTDFLDWLVATYNTCYQEYKDDLAAKASPQPNNDLDSKLHALYSDLQQTSPANSYEHIIKSSKVIAQHVIPGFDYDKVEDIQTDYLKESQKVIDTEKDDIRQLTNKLDEISAQFQKTMAEHLDAAVFPNMTSLSN